MPATLRRSPPYTDNSASSEHAIWYDNLFELGFDNTGNPAIFAWESQSPLVLLDPEFNVRGVTAVFTGWSFSGYPNGTQATWEGSEIPTPYTKEHMMYKRRNVVATANFTIPKVTYLDFDGTSGKMAERTDECELVNAETTEFTTGKVYAVVRDITIANRITVWSTPENPAKLVLCDGATLTAANGIDVFAGKALVICGQALGSGTLEATGSAGAAGIGGGGIVTINGGTVMAAGGSSGAGIGGGTVTINGGTVTATGNGGAAGIAGTVKFADGIAYGVAAGAAETNAIYKTAAAYATDPSAAYVALPYFSLKIPATDGCSYEVSYVGVQSKAVLADQTNTYAIAAGATARVRFTLEEDYVWVKEPVDNPMIIANLSGDTVVDAADLPTVKFMKKGSAGNPWAVGYSTRDSVAAWTNGTDKLVVEGAGNMKDFASGAPWGTGITEVEIGEDVTSIGARAFADSQLGSVTIPASVTSIGAAAFFGSTSLSNVVVEAMTPPALGEGAFVELAEGYKICVPAGTGAAYKAAPGWSLYADSIVEGEPGNPGNPWPVGKTAGDSVVAYTNGVGGLVVEGEGDMRDFDPSKDYAPWGTHISEVEIGEDVTGVGANSFFFADELGSATIPETVTNIGNAAFFGCKSLTNVTVKAMTPPTLGADALENVAEDLTIYVPYGTGEDYKAAPGWSDFADSIVELPRPIVAESDEFTVDLRPRIEFEKGKTRIDVVTWSATAWGAVPASMSTDIGWMNLDTQANGTLASDLTGEDAADFDLPAKDGEYVLTHSTGNFLSFATFVVSGTGNPIGSMANPWSIGSGEGDTVVAYVTDDGELVIGGSGAMGDQFVENPPWKKGGITSLTIGRNVTSIPDYAFFGYTELTNVAFATGAQLGSIGSHAFAACSNMEELEIPASVTTCGPAVVAGTPNVTVSEDNKTFAVVGGALCDIKSNKVISGLDAAVVTIPEGMVEIGECAFSTNGALTSVTIPATMMAIGEDAFRGCANLTNVFVRATEPPTLVQGAFEDCNGGLKIYVPEGKAQTYMTDWGWSDYASKIGDMKGAGSKTNPWTVGTGVTAYIEDGTLVIEGQGAMEDFTADHPAPWMDAVSDIESVEIGKGVTKIGNAAFIDFTITAPGTFTVDDEAHELNLLAFVTPDMGSTNTLATGVFRVVTSETGKAEPAVGFGPKDSTLFYGSVEEALTYGDTTSMQVLTLADMVNREKAYLTGIAGDEPYSQTMQKALDEAFEALDGAKSYSDVVNVHNTSDSKIKDQAEKDKTHEIEGTDITWRVMDGSLVIEGEGEMPDFVPPAFTNGAPWDAYKGDISNATVAAGIESLGKAAFANCPTGPDKTVTFENPKAVINLTAFVSDDGSVTNDFTVKQILLPTADGGVTNAVTLIADADPESPRYASIAEAIAKDEVSSVVAYTLDGLKEMAEAWVSDTAGP